MFKKWLATKTDEDRTSYVKARNTYKKIVKKAVRESWNRYGDHLSEISKTSSNM